uniref:TolC family protein n=1 Tax=Roseihalotalea indica TaxID=2867963 RepID=A0AA49GSW4_9BACT|nr:TolC family protein [Tunicatimonas sp. TK19036]
MNTTKYLLKISILRSATLSHFIEQIILSMIPGLFLPIRQFHISNIHLAIKQVLIPTLFLSISAITSIKAQSLDNYLQAAVENNPSVEAAYQEYLAALEKPGQVALNNPELSGGYFLHPMETRLGAQRARVSISQQFPWFGALRTEKDISRQQARVQEYQWASQKLELMYQVKQAYFRLYDVEKDIDILQQTLVLLQSYERLATQQYENGLARMVDILQAQMQIRETETMITIRQEEKAPLLTQFNNLLNRDINEPVMLPDTLALPETEDTRSLLNQDSVWQHYPDYQAVQAQQGMLEAQGEMARLSGKPMFGVGIEYMVITPRTDMEVPDNGRDGLMPMATVSLPLWRKKYASAQQEVLLRQQANQASAQQLANELTTAWAQAQQQRQAALREVQLYQAQTEQTQQALRILESAYSNEGEDFTDILDFQQQLLDYQMKLVDAVVRYHIAQAQLDKLIYTPQ